MSTIDSSTTYKELSHRGAQMRRDLMGDEYVELSAKTTHSVPPMSDFLEVANVNLFGMLWSRPGLDLKSRVLVVIASDVTGGHLTELEYHLEMALRLGWTKAELGEAILQLIGYAGAPLTRQALLRATDVFNRWESSQEKAKADEAHTG